MNSILIKDYQIHRELEIEFNKNITTITGATDCGKSAVLRCIKWVMLNSPKGDAFINGEAKKASGTIQIEGHTINRERGTSTNTYKLDKKPLEAFRNDVPAEISSILNVNELNFQRQFDNPFWFKETAGEISRQLNKIVDLEKMDVVMADLDSQSRKQNTKVELLEEQRDGIKKEGKKLQWTKQAHKDLVELEERLVDAEIKALQTEKLNNTINRITEQGTTISTVTAIISAMNAVFEKGNKWRMSRNTLASIQGLTEEIQELEKEAKKEIPPSVGYLGDLLQSYEEIKKRRKLLSSHIINIQKHEQDVHFISKTLSGQEKLFKKEMGDKCILCGAPKDWKDGERNSRCCDGI